MDDIIHKLVRRFKTNDPFEIAKGLNILIRHAELDPGTRGFTIGGYEGDLLSFTMDCLKSGGV